MFNTTSTYVFGEWHISTHAYPTSTRCTIMCSAAKG